MNCDNSLQLVLKQRAVMITKVLCYVLLQVTSLGSGFPDVMQCQMVSHCVKPRRHPAKFDPLSIPCTTTSSPNHGMSEASFRLRQALLTPRQVLPNIFAVSVLISTSTLYATSRPTTAASTIAHTASVAASHARQCHVKPPPCRVTAASPTRHAASNFIHAASPVAHAASNLTTSTVTLNYSESEFERGPLFSDNSDATSLESADELSETVVPSLPAEECPPVKRRCAPQARRVQRRRKRK
ncbi:hypothetical protein BDR06DRAFT_994212 [Suillus hirtellus]|nr:hypothetical protein BDR06DRAFT_994212 [Suillus hirtellus]